MPAWLAGCLAVERREIYFAGIPKTFQCKRREEEKVDELKKTKEEQRPDSYTPAERVW